MPRLSRLKPSDLTSLVAASSPDSLSHTFVHEPWRGGDFILRVQPELLRGGRFQINVAEEAGIDGNQTTSLEGVIAMDPEIIIIAQPVEFGAEEFRQSLLANEALAEIPAIKDNRVHLVESKHFTTLSYWNIRGAEDLARILWPEDFPEPSTAPFSLAE